MKAALLPDRGVVKVAGEDARKFLNGLLTADLAKVTPGRAAFAALLTPQGKIMVDMIVTEAPAEDGGGFFLDCPRALCQNPRGSAQFLQAARQGDRRGPVRGARRDGGLGRQRRNRIRPMLSPTRACRRSGCAACCRPHLVAEAAADLGATLVDATEHDAHRIALGVPRGGLDFQYNDAFPHEADMDQLNGIDFEKGCYVGQEVVSRVEHRGTARKRVVPVTFRGLRAGGRRAGQGRRDRGRHHGLVGQGPRPCDAASRPDRRCARGVAHRSSPAASTLAPVKPAWARFDWPGEAKAAE